MVLLLLLLLLKLVLHQPLLFGGGVTGTLALCCAGCLLGPQHVGRGPAGCVWAHACCPVIPGLLLPQPLTSQHCPPTMGCRRPGGGGS